MRQSLQENTDLRVSALPGHISGQPVVIVLGPRVGPSLHQEPNRLQEARLGRVVQRRGPRAAVRHVRVCSALQQEVGHRRAAHHHHLHQNNTDFNWSSFILFITKNVEV